MNETPTESHRTGTDVIIVLITLAIFTVGGGGGVLYLIATKAADGAIAHVVPMVTFALGAVAGVLSRTTRQSGSVPVNVTNAASNPVPTMEEVNQ